MTLVYIAEVPSVSIPSLALELDVKDCTIDYDATRAPCLEAVIIIPLPDEAVMETIDPRDDLRVLIEAEVEWVSPAAPTQSRTFDLLLHKRTIDHEADLVVLVCHSDEALLIDGGYIDDDEVYTDLRGGAGQTLRNVVQGVLGLADTGGTLEAGAADADMTVTRNRVNLCVNPSSEHATAAWGVSTVTNASALARASAVTAWIGTYSTRWTAAAGTSVVRATSDAAGGYLPVTPGKRYRWNSEVRSSIARNCYLTIRFLSEDGSQSLDVDGNNFTTLTTGWINPVGGKEVIATAPAWATKAAPFITTTGNSAGQFHYTDARIFTELADDEELSEHGAVEVYWDGVNNFDPTYYTVEWEGVADESPSLLVKIDDREPQFFDLEPGENWWEYLDPAVRVNGFRLWCDESRDWWLTDIDETVAGTVTIAEGVNVIDAEDEISWQTTSDSGTPLYFTGAVVRYRWMVDGVQQTRYDVAGTGRKVIRVDIDRPWPGPGRAAAILARAEGRGRTQELVAVMNLDATPGMALSTDLPSTPEQIGVVSAVTWRWSDGTDHGTMTVRARDLVEAP